MDSQNQSLATIQPETPDSPVTIHYNPRSIQMYFISENELETLGIVGRAHLIEKNFEKICFIPTGFEALRFHAYLQTLFLLEQIQCDVP